MINRQLIKKYQPEIVSALLLIAYTIIRTLIVAGGISPVSNADWRVFLVIEVVTTVPYVWALGDIVRASLNKAKRSTFRNFVAITTALVAFAAPYIYLILTGAAQTNQGLIILLFMVVVFALPSAIKFYSRMREKHRSNL